MSAVEEALRWNSSCHKLQPKGGTILANLTSDVIFLILVAVIAWLLVFFLRRRPIQRFFSIGESKRLVVYLSNHTVEQGESRGADNEPRSYKGLAVSFYELLVAEKIRNLFSYPFPSFADKPGILSKLLVSDAQVQIFPAPFNPENLEYSASVISLGSPGYNTASAFIEQWGDSQARFVSGFQAVAVEGIQPESNTLYGFIERIYDADKQRSLFYVAGLSELGTAGAAYYLATHWHKIRKQFGDSKNFIVMLRFDPGDYTRQPVEVYAKEGTHRRIISVEEREAAQRGETSQAISAPTIMTAAGPMTVSALNKLASPEGTDGPRPSVTTSGEKWSPPRALGVQSIQPPTKAPDIAAPNSGGTAIPVNPLPQKPADDESSPSS